ncbi:MAG: nicotinate-nucleotide adenylyltransferase [Dehalococcoidia bacterium]
MLLLGGTFDPPHLGHLLLAECARVELGEGRVVFMPAGDPWRKTLPGAVAAAVPARQVTPARQRLAMLRLAVRGNAAFAVDDREVRRKGPTYTSDTLAELQAEGETDVTLLLGSDAVADMRYWHEPGRILELARVAAVVKPGGMPVAEAVRALAGVVPGAAGRVVEVGSMPPLAISSTLIRERVAAGLPVRYLVPDAVEQYIRTRGLYAGGGSP